LRQAAPAEQGVVSHTALLRQKSVLGTDNALVGTEGASSAEFHSALQIQRNTVVGHNGGRSTLRPLPNLSSVGVYQPLFEKPLSPPRCDIIPIDWIPAQAELTGDEAVANLNIVWAILIFAILILSIDVHEFSHAMVAYRLGDPTPARQGRLTLNPIAHLDPVGTLMMVFAALSGIGIGWGKPVQVNPFYMKGNPRLKMGLVSAAGPTANVVLAILAGLPIRLGLVHGGAIATFLLYVVLMNLGLAVFNLIPLSPLDGYAVLLAIFEYFKAWNLADEWAQLERWGPGLLLTLLMIDWFMPVHVLSMLLWPPVRFMMRIIVGG